MSGGEVTADRERRLLQIATAIACFVPISAGAMGMVEGPGMLRGLAAPLPVDLESHYRYLSGLLLGIGIGFAATIRRIENKAALLRTLGAIIVLGGLGRLGGLVQFGAPGTGHVFGLAMELGVTPLILLWQARIERRCAAPHERRGTH